MLLLMAAGDAAVVALHWPLTAVAGGVGLAVGCWVPKLPAVCCE